MLPPLAGGRLPGGDGGSAGAPGGPGQLCNAQGLVATSTGAGAGTATTGGVGGVSAVRTDAGVLVDRSRGFAGALGVGADGSGGAGGGGRYGGGSGASIVFVEGDPAFTAVSAGGGGGGSSLPAPGGTVDLASGPARVTISYTTTSVGGASEKLTALGHAVAGVGPGTSLAAKVTTAQRALVRGDTAGACGALTGFVNEVAAQSGRKVPVATATQLVAAAHDVRTTLRC